MRGRQVGVAALAMVRQASEWLLELVTTRWPSRRQCELLNGCQMGHLSPTLGFAPIWSKQLNGGTWLACCLALESPALHPRVFVQQAVVNGPIQCRA